MAKRTTKTLYHVENHTNGVKYAIYLDNQTSKTMDLLIKGPIPAPALGGRGTEQIFRMRGKGVNIKTHMVKNEKTGNKYGIYELLDKVNKVAGF